MTKQSLKKPRLRLLYPDYVGTRNDTGEGEVNKQLLSSVALTISFFVAMMSLMVMRQEQRKRGRFTGMLIPTIVMAALAIILLAIGYFRGDSAHVQGLKTTGNLLLQVIPLLIFSFIVAGMIQTLIPGEMISRWVGTESGFRGILLGTAVGSLVPGGPYVSLPIAAGFLRAGAGVGTLVSFVAAWALIQLPGLPLHIGLLGWKFTAIRLGCTFFFPPIAGLLATRLFPHVSLLQ